MHGHGEASTAKLFEKIKVMFQDLPGRLERVVLGDRRSRRRGMHHIHPAMVDELLMVVPRDKPRPGLVAMIATSFVQDELPWLYDMAVEVYCRSFVGDKEAETRAAREFMRTWETTLHGPLPHVLELDRENYVMTRELMSLMDRVGTVSTEEGASGE